ncbi:hypothetical protein ACQKNB_23890 [Lysinibacillus xylanilyticus]|uniref:hypothetical protein n=1 Tax=Lysinibacillus xylanilyticus TaxID=582475 RepID=UPI003CFC15CA
MRSSTPLKKEISALVVLMMQLGSGEICGEELSVIGSSVTGTIVSLVVDIKKHLLLIDTFIIVPEVPGYLYALFDYGLTSFYTINEANSA